MSVPTRLYLPFRSQISAEYILVDDVLPDRLAIQRAQQVAGSLLAHAVQRLAGDACDMRRDDDIGQLEQRVTEGRRFLLEHIESGAGQLAGYQRRVQCPPDDDPAPGRVA